MNPAEQLPHETSYPRVRAGLDAGAGGFPELDVIQAARAGACVLLTGGSNARGIALQIHNLSGWRWGRFLSVDCGASEQILERQLFDLLESGAAEDEDVEPQAQLMQDGTIFLDEVGRLSLAQQVRLADALDTGPGEAHRRLRKRIMASTSVPLLDRVRAGTFDDRLFYRLNAIHFAPADMAPDETRSNSNGRKASEYGIPPAVRR